MQVYLLWQGDDYVDLDGTQECEDVTGVFSSIEAMNRYKNEKWFDCVADFRGEDFTEQKQKLEKNGKRSKCYMYYDVWAIDNSDS